MKFLAGVRRCFDLQMQRKAECWGEQRCFDVSDLFFFFFFSPPGSSEAESHVVPFLCRCFLFYLNF